MTFNDVLWRLTTLLNRFSKQDFDDFDVSNEDDVLEEFLGIAKNAPASSAPTTTTTDQPKQEPKTEKPSDKLG